MSFHSLSRIIKTLSMKHFTVLVIAILLSHAFIEAASSIGNSADALTKIDETGNILTSLPEAYRPYRFNCSQACSRRCSKASRKNRCRRACKACCAKCNCVPAGTYGNKKACPCYARLRTRGNRFKCP